MVKSDDDKPRLPAGREPLEFNLSHSGPLMLLALGPRPVGIDIERLDPTRDLLGLAARALGPEDLAAVRAATAAARPATFYDRWVRHEATLKCLGGRQASSSEAPVAVAPLPIDPGYAAAIAVAGEEVPPLRSLDFGAPARQSEAPLPAR